MNSPDISCAKERPQLPWETIDTVLLDMDGTLLDKHFDDYFWEQYVPEHYSLLRDIPVQSVCEHHMAAIQGVAHVAYLPGKDVVGISKLARLVDAYSRRLQIQERLTAEIADTLQHELQARGVAVVIRASHGCMTTRGVHTHGTSMVTRRLLGDCANEPYRSEVLKMLMD